MEAAGRAVARAIQRHIRRCRVLVLAGPGNNGGDGYIAARLLAQEGWPVRLAALAPPRAVRRRRRGPPLARPHGPFTPEERPAPDVVIDAVFGAGLTRPLDGLVADTLRAAAESSPSTFPRGLDGATGRALGTPRAGRTDRHLLPPEARPPAAARPRPVRRGSSWPTSASPTPFWTAIAPAPSRNLPTLWPLPAPDRRRPQIHAAAT